MKTVLEEIPTAKLIVVGDGPYKPELERRIIQKELTDNIILVGRKADKELPFFYAASDLCVLPMVYPAATKELSVLEALASGKTVVGIQRDAETLLNEEIVNDESSKNPILVYNEKDFVENIIYLLQNSKKTKALGLKGRKLVEQTFTWKKVAENTLKIYKSVVN
jgi:phosphatidylinositol alpha-1,6-mannosyltransferase